MNATPIKFSLVQTTDDAFVTVFAPGRDPLPANSSHPNFDRIVGLCHASVSGEDIDVQALCDLFDVAETVRRKFQRLSERITVDASGIKIDGDPVDNVLSDQILSFLDEGHDFTPLVNFYEKLLTNPLPSVQDTLYGWIAGQTAGGTKLTITEDGDVVGYKGVYDAGNGRYRPSREGKGIVNGVETTTSYIEQAVDDVVEMPRRTLTEPSHECGVGLHVGTWEYAERFGPITLAVKFSPRDVVSAPDANSSWKVRVCRYTVIDVVERAYDSSLFGSETPDLTFDADEWLPKRGDTVRDRESGGTGIVIEPLDDDNEVYVRWDDDEDGEGYVDIDLIRPA